MFYALKTHGQQIPGQLMPVAKLRQDFIQKTAHLALRQCHNAGADVARPPLAGESERAYEHTRPVWIQRYTGPLYVEATHSGIYLNMRWRRVKRLSGQRLSNLTLCFRLQVRRGAKRAQGVLCEAHVRN